MGMVGNYLRVSKSDLEEYLADSSKLEDRVYNEETDSDDNLVYIDKSWEGIFFLLTGTGIGNSVKATAPLRWILIAPQEIDPDQDLGYGPACYTSIEQTKEIHNALNKITLDELKNRYNSEAMMELSVYPEIWNDLDALEYLLDNYIVLKEFYEKAALENQAVIIFLN
ncbi:MAG: hypothetical protein CFE21_09475 [Bacteroidetes bacterium B1(2017)]|nr:MAG: hypothetical protein CFE21_09475 [Bacteroidetes bacterium B1(2017)]